MASSGTLPPTQAAQGVLDTGYHHLSEAAQLTFFKNIFGGLLLSAGGLLALILATGSPGLTEANPGLAQLLQGMSFPIGLVLVYTVGAELFTGYPMWFLMTALERKGRAIQYVRGAVFSWFGNLIGAVMFAGLFTYLTKTVTEEPFKSGIISMVTEDIVEQQWHVTFLRGIVCGFLVTVAMFLGTQCHDGVSKFLGLHLPFFISTTAKCPHTVEYMYLGAVGMMLGAPLSVGAYFWKCLLPITLGNIVGGSLFTGAYLWWVFIVCADEKAGHGDSNGWASVGLSDDD